MTERLQENAKPGPRFSQGSRISLIAVAVAVITMLLSGDAAAADQRPVPGFDLQGHRGARGLMPENSLPAFEKALALGVTTLELDTVLTADGVVVVHHDRRLAPERTRDASGAWIAEAGPPAIIELTQAELATYDIGRAKPGSRYAQRWPRQTGLDGVRIPTLLTVLARAEEISGGTVRYNIEIKISPEAPNDSADPAVFARALVEVIRQAGVGGRAAVQSFDWRTLQEVQRLAPGIATVYLTAEQDWLDNLGRKSAKPSAWIAGLDIDWAEVSLPQAIAQAGGAVWSPYFRDLREPDLREAQDLGLRVVPWTVNDPAAMAALIERGVDGLITDYPGRAHAVMTEKGLPLPPAFGGE